jgi:hypothetical protein
MRQESNMHVYSPLQNEDMQAFSAPESIDLWLVVKYPATIIFSKLSKDCFAVQGSPLDGVPSANIHVTVFFKCWKRILSHAGISAEA